MKNNYKETKHHYKDTTNHHRDTKSNKGSKTRDDDVDVDDVDEGGFSLSVLPVCPETVNLLVLKRLLTTERRAAVFFCVVALEKLCRRNKQLRLSASARVRRAFECSSHFSLQRFVIWRLNNHN